MKSLNAPLIPSNKPKLPDQLRAAIRLRHDSIHPEEASVQWAHRFILFLGKRHPEEMGRPYSNGTKAAGAQGCRHHDGLYACAEAGRKRGSQPLRRYLISPWPCSIRRGELQAGNVSGDSFELF